MSLGIIILCHTALDRVAQVARHWQRNGCPVVIHVDRRVPQAEMARLSRRLEGVAGVSFCRRIACDWGTWSLVAATQAAAERILADHPDVRHVCLTSGSCLPLRPVAEFRDYLERHPQTDFIESVTTADVGWTVGGLDLERFTLRFPFPWKRQRRLFDSYVVLQRRLGLKRAVPAGIEPHLGSQWWCLTRKTLTAILSAPDRPKFDRYFRHVWIPDESYFQTMARRYSTRIESRSLTLSKFDHQGRPHIFFDDHLTLLQQSDRFVARKIWPHADLLYAAFLDPDGPKTHPVHPDPGRIDRVFATAIDRRMRGRAGLYMQSRYPRQDHENGKTSGPYSVLHGFSDLFEDFRPWLAAATGATVHGHVFAPARAEFAGGESLIRGALSDSAALRDHNPRAFLTNFIWNAQGEHQCFQFGPRDSQACNWFMATDPNAQISVISGAWAVALWRTQAAFSDLRREAARLQRIEADHLSILRSMYVKARVRIWTLGEFLEDPMGNLQAIVDEIAPPNRRRLTEAPRLVALDGLEGFVQHLRNQGMQPTLVGNLVPMPAHDPETRAPARPYLVG